ncbi:LysR family transcriptional regulator [Pseudomonas syringae]|uniref:LysR family transcriptional regulator n=1 Tax=Pseudomonas syringae TaxID=317 RepID=UPI00020984C6|nr:LysR family transcriptional regulator [Pseudomonas syringae]EGH71503.1 LysR family transcriptional regulator [Pseudomonas syringae pv. aceris str. M302273]
MNFKQLHSFVEVVHQGGFTEAAKVLNLSQSTVSKHVALLEQNLGDKVLQRMGGAGAPHRCRPDRIATRRAVAVDAQRPRDATDSIKWSSIRWTQRVRTSSRHHSPFTP